MNHGPLIFLAAFFALASSWCGFVLTPQLQIGRLQQTNAVGSAAATYPVARSGLARQGLEVYRANGCAYCHSQQVGQTGTELEIGLTDVGTNQAATMATLLKLATPREDQAVVMTPLPALEAVRGNSNAAALSAGRALLLSSSREAANAAVGTLNGTGAKAQLWIVPVGPDLARGWGKRRTVAEDYLFDSPVMPGSQRVGPDLANVGARLPDANWHLLHLYAPQHQVKGSTMPPYRFLFEKRKVERHASLDALVLPPDMTPAPGYELIPTPAAKALAAYLVSLRADAPLFHAPLTVLAAATPNMTNAASANAAAK
jgi:cbb3-type cytochrome oxidase cytochrome c subunit